MEKWQGRVALVTGAASGIGKATVLKLISCKMIVVACDRETDRLQDLESNIFSQAVDCKLHIITCDLSIEEEINKMFERITHEVGAVDVCVNCAGVSHQATLLDGSVTHFRDMFNINVMAYVLCSRLSIKSMMSKNIDDGHVIFIGSMKGHRVRTGKPEHSDYNFYNATKFAIRAISEGLSNELRMRKSGIRVTLLSPGLVRTDLTYRMYPDQKEKVDNLYDNVKPLEGEDVANGVVYALSCPGHVQIQDMLLLATEQM